MLLALGYPILGFRHICLQGSGFRYVCIYKAVNIYRTSMYLYSYIYICFHVFMHASGDALIDGLRPGGRAAEGANRREDCWVDCIAGLRMQELCGLGFWMSGVWVSGVDLGG